jgi:hypothetical protein
MPKRKKDASPAKESLEQKSGVIPLNYIAFLGSKGFGLDRKINGRRSVYERQI